MLPFLLTMSLMMIRVSAENDTDMQEPCDGVIFRGTYYDKDALFAGLQKPTNLMIHYDYLFFSQTIMNGTGTYSSILSCHIDNGTCTDITGVPGGRAITYDRWSSAIYFGGTDGIYRYHAKKNELTFVANKNNTILGIAFRRNVFKIDRTTKEFYAWLFGRYSKIPNVVGVDEDNIFVASRLDIYFYNKTGLYTINKHTNLAHILSNNITVRQITEDIDGDVFFGAKDGVYIYDVALESIRKVADIDDVYGITFARSVTSPDSYQFVYSNDDSVFVLAASYREEKCEKILKKSDKSLTEEEHIYSNI